MPAPEPLPVEEVDEAGGFCAVELPELDELSAGFCCPDDEAFCCAAGFSACGVTTTVVGFCAVELAALCDSEAAPELLELPEPPELSCPDCATTAVAGDGSADGASRMLATSMSVPAPSMQSVIINICLLESCFRFFFGILPNRLYSSFFVGRGQGKHEKVRKARTKKRSRPVRVGRPLKAEENYFGDAPNRQQRGKIHCLNRIMHVIMPRGMLYCYCSLCGAGGLRESPSVLLSRQKHPAGHQAGGVS